MKLTVNPSGKNAEILNKDELHRIPRHESEETRAYCYKPNFLAFKTHYEVLCSRDDGRDLQCGYTKGRRWWYGNIRRGHDQEDIVKIVEMKWWFGG
jgi:hypothetical protein